MDWKRLLKSIGVAMLLIFGVVAIWAGLLYNSTLRLVLLAALALAAFILLVAAIYHSEMK